MGFNSPFKGLTKVYEVVCSIEVFRTIIHMPFSSSLWVLRAPSSLPSLIQSP